MERIDTRLEQKIGFDRIRKIISDKCSTTYTADRTATEVFSNKASEIRRRLLLTDEMRLIMMFEDSFPSGGSPALPLMFGSNAFFFFSSLHEVSVRIVAKATSMYFNVLFMVLLFI